MTSESLMLDVAPNVYGRDCRCDVGGMVPFGPLVVRQQKLLGWSQQRYSQMQALQGIGIFLKPPFFFGLRSAAFHGPAILRLSSVYHISSSIIVSVGYRHPHPLILLHNSPPSIVATSNDSYIHANKLQDRFIGLNALLSCVQ